LARGLMWILQYPFKLRAFLFSVVNYKAIYQSVVEKAKQEGRSKGTGVYYEAHHIVPECLGGGGRVTQWKTHSNIVLLTGKEHFICHRLLCKIYPDNLKLAHAFWGMCNQHRNYQDRYVASPRAYEEARSMHSKILAQSMKGHTLNSGRKQSEEHIRKRMKFVKNIVRSEEYRRKISEANCKRVLDTRTNTTYQSLSAAAKALNCSVANISYYLKKGLYIRI
jgi:predicted RNase H-like nuclease